MKSLLKTLVILSLMTVSGCVPFWRTWWRDMGFGEHSAGQPAHESWCYKTLAEIECYPGPQRLSPESLVSVDPPSRFPLTREGHAKALNEARRDK